MEPNEMKSQNRDIRYLRTITALGVGVSLLAGCSLGSNGLNTSSTQPDSFSPNGASALDLNFPQATCGETSTEPRETWYVVYIDRANPDEIRRQYCNDAIGTVRKTTGVPTVQVASFIDYGQALKFATAVGGEVEVATGDQKAAGSTPDRTIQPEQTADTAYLKASDPGSLINIRERASTSAPVQQTGRAGDQIQIADEQQGDDGQIWFKVSLPGGQDGWVRSDFVSRTQSGGTTTGQIQPQQGQGQAQVGSIPPQTQTGANSSAQTNGSSIAGSSSADRYNASSSGSLNSGSDSSGNSSSQQSAALGSSSSYTSTSRNDREQANRYEPEPYTTSSTEGSSAASSNGPTLVANDPGAVINIRDDASTTASVRHTGYAGDPVFISDATQGDDGYTWYYVEFDSGVSGWVRGDFVDE
jgi:hypothetical protein